MWKYPFEITNRKEDFEAYEGPRIYYGKAPSYTCIHIEPHGLLFETGVQFQEIECFTQLHYPAFFKSAGNGYPFDIFSAVFYLISRYEEYLPHSKDMYGRYPHTESLAFREGFLNIPLVNYWLTDLLQSIRRLYPGFQPTGDVFRFVPTYDIDIAWSYKHKGFRRNAGGWLKKPGLERCMVLAGLKPDPYDSFTLIEQLSVQYHHQPIFFFLLSEDRSRYNKNISPAHPAMRALIHRLKKYRTGIHPSYNSMLQSGLIDKEISVLQNITEKPVRDSRQHYLRFNLPETFRFLIRAGIVNEFSMGYGSINGFRASVAHPFYWYNLEAEQITPLKIHPFCFMDANSYFEQKQDVATTFQELNDYYEKCRSVHGCFITIFHNHMLGSDKMFTGWSEMYTQFASRIS
ncbi:MAG: polysaccharide deacetylase family protein [Ferruginibacter sp.]|nr:polysaccharide deacetylase family protein [Ferruginibacter sp.]